MNNQRNKVFWDDSARQAKADGVYSFGRIIGGYWTDRQIAEYSAAATARGVEFLVDEDGVGYFKDPDLGS